MSINWQDTENHHFLRHRDTANHINTNPQRSARSTGTDVTGTDETQPIIILRDTENHHYLRHRDTANHINKTHQLSARSTGTDETQSIISLWDTETLRITPTQTFNSLLDRRANSSSYFPSTRLYVFVFLCLYVSMSRCAYVSMSLSTDWLDFLLSFLLSNRQSSLLFFFFILRLFIKD